MLLFLLYKENRQMRKPKIVTTILKISFELCTKNIVVQKIPGKENNPTCTA